MLLRLMVRWFASLPISLVGANSVMAGTVVAVLEMDTEMAGDYAKVLAIMVLPIVSWLACRMLMGPPAK